MCGTHTHRERACGLRELEREGERESERERRRDGQEEKV